MFVANCWTLNVGAENVAVLVYLLNTVWNKTTASCECVFCNNVSLDVLKFDLINVGLDDVTVN